MHTINLYYGARLYSNRIIGETLPDPKYTFDNINFISGNGIQTTQTINGVDSDESPSYLTATDETGKTTEWFVIQCIKTRKSQINLTLRRDFLDEYWTQLENQPFICEKAGTIPDSLSDAKYKKTMNLSQIKRESHSIYDSNVAEWAQSNARIQGYVVGYYSKTNNDSLSGIISLDDGYETLSVTIPKTRAWNTVDSAYNIFAIPVGDYYSYTTSLTQTTYKANITLQQAVTIGTLMCSTLAEGAYDLQYLPYISIQTSSLYDTTLRAIDGVYDITINDDTTHDITHIGAVLMLGRSSRRSTSVRLRWSGIDEIYYDGRTPMYQRKDNEFNMYRLASPNQASAFEFSPVRNGGFSMLSLYVALKPQTPYIRVAPVFNGLYGNNFNDGRGLICGGDFSLTMVNDAWQTFQVQNKNYQLMFDRNIQSMEINAAMDIYRAAQPNTGRLVGDAVGAVGNYMSGNYVGMGENIIDAVGSRKQTLTNTAMSIISNVDRIDNAKDQFQYQIGNIQALPQTLTKLSAVTPDFMIYPQLEVYSGTSQEWANLESSIEYNGIEINMMTQLSVFDHGFIRGTIIKFPEDMHISDEQAAAINAELNTGIYYKEV